MLTSQNTEYQNVRLAIGDSNREVRLTLLSQFNTFGFSNVLHSGGMRDIYNAVTKDRLDVIICDEKIDRKFYDFVTDIRHQRVGHNPFMIIIATTSNLTAEKVRRLTDTGIDDVIGKPLSVGKLLERLKKIATSRKPFVVTTDYTGPDRRKGHRPGSMEIPQIDAPNPLVYLMDKIPAKDEISDAIAKASATINDQKMERHAFQIGFLVDRILPLYEEFKADEIDVADLDKLRYVSEDINKRLKNSKYSDAADLCHSMADLANRFRRTHPNPREKDLELMPILSQAIQMAFQGGDDVSSTVKEIVESLRRQDMISSPDK